MAKKQGSGSGVARGSSAGATKPVPTVTTIIPPLKNPGYIASRTAAAAGTGSAARKPLNGSQQIKPVDFIFTRLNYQVMLGGIAVIALGFYLMSGTTDIMSPTKIIVAPIVVLCGFAIEFIAIFIKPRKIT